MRSRAATLALVVLLGALPAAHADNASGPVPSPAGSVQFTVRICEGKGDLQFWFNQEASEHWNRCEHPLPDIPVYLITDGKKEGEGKTNAEGIATLPAVALAENEKFRMMMACTTHRCFSIRELFIGAPDVAPGANTLFAETPVRPPQSKN